MSESLAAYALSRKAKLQGTGNGQLPASWLRGDASLAEGYRVRCSPSHEVWRKSARGGKNIDLPGLLPNVEGVTGKYFVKSIPNWSASISLDKSLHRQLWEQSARLVNL